MGQGTDPVTGHDRTDELRRDIERTQREMSRTIDEIQHRLSPHYMMQRTKDSMREAGVNASRGFMDKVRDNPIPAAMVGIGLFLLMRDSKGRDTYEVDFIPERPAGWNAEGWDGRGTTYSSVAEYRDLEYGDRNAGGAGRVNEARERISHAADAAREKVGDAVSSAREATSATLDSAAERARDLKYRARYQMSRARYQSRDILQENPLIAGVAAIAAGAILGALIPESDKENELLGDTRDRLMDRGKDMARDGVNRAREVATAAAGAATDAAKSEIKEQKRGSGAQKTDIGQNVGIGGTPT
jgi:ElaB/YqjD/DUF883 family membrane-anchored ribosome-binding protein